MRGVRAAPAVLGLARWIGVCFCVRLGAQELTVVDDFELGANPNRWNWTNIQGDAPIDAAGGHPGAWVDTGMLYFATHAHFISVPPTGSALRVALASGRLRTAAIDIERIDETGVSGCQPTHLEASFIALALFDSHSADVDIQAHTTADASPAYPQGAFPWMTARFTIPEASDATPAGWRLDVPLGMTYTWADLMRNVDGIRFYVGDPEQHAFSACVHLGADNVVVTYAGDDDTIFADGFEVPATGAAAATSPTAIRTHE